MKTFKFMSRRWDPCDSEKLKKVSEQLDMVASGWRWLPVVSQLAYEH